MRNPTAADWSNKHHLQAFPLDQAHPFSSSYSTLFRKNTTGGRCLPSQGYQIWRALNVIAHAPQFTNANGFVLVAKNSRAKSFHEEVNLYWYTFVTDAVLSWRQECAALAAFVHEMQTPWQHHKNVNVQGGNTNNECLSFLFSKKALSRLLGCD